MALPLAAIGQTTHLEPVWYPTVDLHYFCKVSVGESKPFEQQRTENSNKDHVTYV